MGGHRLARPDGADLPGGVVADGEDEIQFRSTGLGKLLPGFGAQTVGWEIQLLKQVQNRRINMPLGMTARAETFEFTAAFPIENAFGHDAAR